MRTPTASPSTSGSSWAVIEPSSIIFKTATDANQSLMKAQLTMVKAKLPHKIDSSGQLRDNAWHLNPTIEFTHLCDQYVNLTFVDGRIALGEDREAPCEIGESVGPYNSGSVWRWPHGSQM